jgi:predicted regulator of Ras-like GTPase activity (Roadblock/LC7/MglB family)
MSNVTRRADGLQAALAELMRQAPEVEAAAVVSFDGLPMASSLPAGMDDSRVAAMSAALLSLGERAAEGLGRGDLSQVYIEGDHGTVFLVSADGEAVLVTVVASGAKAGMMLFEARRAAGRVAAVLRESNPAREPRTVADLARESAGSAAFAGPAHPASPDHPGRAPVGAAAPAASGNGAPASGAALTADRGPQQPADSWLLPKGGLPGDEPEPWS